jgi:hypothetical protein
MSALWWAHLALGVLIHLAAPRRSSLVHPGNLTVH